MASTAIKVFGRTYLFAMLLLIGLALFLHPGCFCLVTITVMLRILYLLNLQDLFYRCDPLCSRQITLFNKESCYDECHCSVQSNSFVLHSSNMNWSAISTCRIGPKGVY